MAVGLFVGVWVARYLGPARFGLLSYAQSFVALFAAISTLGLDQILVREIVKYPDKEKELLGTAFVLRLLGAAATLGILTIAVNFTSNDAYTNALIFIIGSATVLQAFKVIDLYFQAKVMSKYAVLANMISVAVSSVVKIILILYHAPLIDFAWVVLFDSCVLAMGYMYFFKKRTASQFQFLKIRTNIAFLLLKNSWPLILSGLAITIYMRIDQIMIKEMLGKKEVGYYSAAVRLSELWLFITVTITNSLFPAILNAKSINEQLYQKRVLQLYRLLAFISIMISLIIYIFANLIVQYTYGPEFKPTTILLQLYVWSIVFVFLNNGAWQWYLAENLQHLATVRLIMGAILNVILNYLLIPRFAAIGAVYSTLISYSLASYFGNLLFSQTRPNFILQTKALLSFYRIY